MENTKKKVAKSFKNQNLIRGFPYFTHFVSIPFIRQSHRQTISSLQLKVRQLFAQQNLQGCLRDHSHLLCHITLFMLTLKQQTLKQKIIQFFQTHREDILSLMKTMAIKTGDIKYFTRFNKNEKINQITVIYLEIQDQEVQSKLNILIDLLVRNLLKEEILVQDQLTSMHIFYDHKSGMFRAQKMHISLFRANNLMENQKVLKLFDRIKNESQKIIMECDYIDISTMLNFDQDQFYKPLTRINLR